MPRLSNRLSIGALAIASCTAPRSPSSDGSSESTSLAPADASTSSGSSSSTSADSSSSNDTLMPFPDLGPPPPPKLCSLEAVDPSADPTIAIDAGDMKGQIPTIIGDALLRNCGCHYTDNVTPGMYVDYLSNKVPMDSYDDFHVDFEGTFPQMYEDMPVYLAVEQRVVFSNPLPMPPGGCGVEGEPFNVRMTAADTELFTEWLAAGAPDGASFP